MNTTAIYSICQEALKPEAQGAVIRSLAAGMLLGNSHENPVMEAFLSLSDIGPKNDWNGERGSAERLKDQMNSVIIQPALTLKTKMLTAAMEVMLHHKTQVWEITDQEGGKRTVSVDTEDELKEKHLASDDLNHVRIS